MICCRNYMEVPQSNWWTEPEPKWKNVSTLQMMNCCRCKQMCSPLSKLIDRWSKLKEKLLILCDDDPLLETDASPSNQLMDRWTNWRRHCFYFAMMICCSWPQQSPSRKLMDRSRTEEENVSTLRWRSAAAKIDVRPLRKFINSSHNRLSHKCFVY